MKKDEIRRIVTECIELSIPAIVDSIVNRIEINEKIEKQSNKGKLIDVHTRHCCLEHKRCKYGEEDTCTVCQGIALPDYPCNCSW